MLQENGSPRPYPHESKTRNLGMEKTGDGGMGGWGDGRWGMGGLGPIFCSLKSPVMDIVLISVFLFIH